MMEFVQRSLTAGILIFCIAVIRVFFINRLPKKIFLVLWGVALVRLLLPISFSMPNPFFYNTDIQMDMVKKETEINMEGTLRSSTQQIEPFESKDDLLSSSITRETFLRKDLWRWIYAAGVVMMIFSWTFLYHRSYRKLAQSLPLQDRSLEKVWESCKTTKRKVRLFTSDQITTPMTYGLVHPKIVLPKGIDCSQNIEYILKHESIHIRRMDTMWKMVMTAALSLHWWNPLVWMMMVLFHRDLEIACDESVLSSWGAQERAEYAMALIQLAEQKIFFSPLGSGFGKNAVQERIVAIMKYKKISMAGILAGVLLTASSLTVFADFDTTKTEQKKSEETKIDSKKMMETEIETAKQTEAAQIDEMNVVAGELMIDADGGTLEGILRSIDGEWYFSDDGKAWIKLSFVSGDSLELESEKDYEIWTEKKETEIDLPDIEEGDPQKEKKAFEEVAEWMKDYEKYGLQFDAETGEL